MDNSNSDYVKLTALEEGEEEFTPEESNSIMAAMKEKGIPEDEIDWSKIGK